MIKILKLVNSSFYGFRSKVSDISNALVPLGFNTNRNSVISVSIIKAFSGKKPWNEQNLNLEIKQALEQYDLNQANKKKLDENVIEGLTFDASCLIEGYRLSEATCDINLIFLSGRFRG